MNSLVPDFPKRIEIELVSDCNLHCVYCPRRYVKGLNGYMDYELFDKIISECQSYPPPVITLHRRGESLLHPRIKDMLNRVQGLFPEVQLATNATMLRPELFEPIVNSLTFLSFSLDYPERFRKTRIGADYEAVTDNILKFVDYNKGRVKIQASMVKTEGTDPLQCQHFIEIWKDRVDRVRIYEEHSSNGNFGSLKHPRKERKPCIMPFYEVLIYSDGNLARCNHDWNGQPLGQVKDNSIAACWHSQAYHDLRQQHLSLDITDQVCRACDSWYPVEREQGTGQVISS